MAYRKPEHMAATTNAWNVLDPRIQQALEKHGYYGIEVATITLVATIVLELYSYSTVRDLWTKQRHGKSLWLKGLLANMVNHYVLGAPVYIVAASLFCTNEVLSLPQQVTAIVNVIFMHAILYYLLHRAAHQYPSLYRYHKFHHQFNTYIPPSSANAVSVVEYFAAYVAPFGIALGVGPPTDPSSLRWSVLYISILNLLVHTPHLEGLSQRVVPSHWLVSTHSHLEHHRTLFVHYASPTINVDSFVNMIQSRIWPSSVVVEDSSPSNDDSHETKKLK